MGKMGKGKERETQKSSFSRKNGVFCMTEPSSHGAIQQLVPRQPERLSLDGEKLQSGLVKLVLTVIETLRVVLEKQGLRRVESGSLSQEEIEKLGLAFIRIKQKIEEMAREFGIAQEELSLNLGARDMSGETTNGAVVLSDILDKLIDEGVLVAGEVRIAVANIDLVALNLLLSLSSIDRLEKISG
jgi:hypothetical protein